MTAPAPGATGAPIVSFDEIDSTNAEARRRAEAGEEGPLWFTARRQSAGRGRRGREWRTGEGNLAATYLFATALPAAQAAQISFVAALAVVDLADAFVSPGLVSVKWPNDLLIGGAKAAGILVESGPGGAGVWIAVGIGVNLAVHPVETIAGALPATSLAAHTVGAPPSRSQALAILAPALERWRALWEAGGFSPIREAWTKRAHGLGLACAARPGAETIEGIALGLDADGALRLRDADGAIRRITAGDVFFARDA